MKKDGRMQKLNSWGRTGIAAAVLATGAGAALNGNVAQADDWKANAISPVTNPVFFEDPQINSEIRPIFAWHGVDKDMGLGGGDAQLYAIQARWAVTDPRSSRSRMATSTSTPRPTKAVAGPISPRA
jgi:hypothetical protein